ncbi:MAG: glycosyltransferase [Planctomycetaceae bacterium]|nr:glycosyltransferase [Planctomycetaceae bacterium]
MSSTKQIPLPFGTTRSTAAGRTPVPEAASSRGERLRICHVSMCLATGGLERLLVEFAKRTDRQRYDVQFITLGEIGAPAEEIRALGHSVTPITRASAGSRGGQLRALARHFREHRIDLVHTHNTYAHFYATLAAKLAGVRTIINTQHGRGCGNHWKQRLHFLLANRFTDRILAVSEDSARLCRQQDPWSRRRIHTLWNGIDLRQFAFHGPVSAPRAISVARLSPEKDFPTLLHAVQGVVKQFPDFHLTLVGEGRERPRLEQLTSQLGLNAHVEFLGERHDVSALLRQSAMFVSSSSTEGISLTLLEAMAVGLPIITTAVGGNPEVVQDGVTGHLVPAGQPARLQAAICAHLAQPDTWQAMGNLARTRVETQFNIERMMREYEETYEQLCGKT